MTTVSYEGGRVWHITLPFPPSVNTLWRRSGHSTYLSQKGRAYRTAAVAVIRSAPTMADAQVECRMEVRITLHAPTKRPYDIDNCSKAVLDALTHAGFWQDDGQVDRLVIQRGVVSKGGFANILIWEITP